MYLPAMLMFNRCVIIKTIVMKSQKLFKPLIVSVILIYIFSIAKAKNPDFLNILLFHADDMTWRDCRPYGNPDVFTPNISMLAEEGMCFENMHTSTAMCSPTRQ